MHGATGKRLLVLFGLLCSLLPAQTGSYEGKRIVAVEMPPLDQLLVPADLNSKLAPLRVGEPLRMADVRSVIENLYGSGRFEDIVVDAHPSGDGVALRIAAIPALFIRNVVVEGVEEPPSPGQLVNATKLELGTRFAASQVKQAVQNLLEVLRSNGFYQSSVTPFTSNAPAQQIDLRFSVDTGGRAKLSPPLIRGKTGLPIDDLARATRWRRFLGLGGWKVMTEQRVEQGLDRLRRLYQKRDYLMAKVSLEQMDYVANGNRVIPILSVDQGAKVRVETKGAKMSKGRLRELVPIYQEQTVDRDLLVEGKRELTEYFQSQGYFDAQVDFDISENAAQEQVILYSFFPGDRHKLVRIDIAGNQYFTKDTIRERMFVHQATTVRFRRGRYSADFLKRDVNAIKALYLSNGFQQVRVEARTEDDHQGKENEVAVFIKIEEGPQYLVSSLQIEGIPQADVEYIRALLHSGEGQPYSDLNVATDQDVVLNYYYNSGRPDAQFEATAVPVPNEPARVALKYTIHEGERRFVRDVLISGLEKSDPGLVRQRIRDLAPNDPLSQSAMIESQRRLYDLGIFARVDTALQNPEGDTRYKYVLYRLEEARKWSVNAGFGAQIARIGKGSPTTLGTPAGSAGFSPRVSLGLSRSNLLGLGHTISFQGRLSNIQRRVLTTYLAPQFKGSERLNLSFTGIYDRSRDVQTFNSRRVEGSVQLEQQLTKANTAQYRLSYRRVSVDSLNINPDLVPLFNRAIQLGIISGTFIQDRRDDATDPRRGLYNTLDVGLASNVFGSRTSFLRALGRNATYHRLGREWVFARSLSMGVISRISAADVPLPERFFAGGSTSHRGFSENQAGPRDLLTGFPLGGKALLMNTSEIRFPLLGENIGGVFFHDMGNVYSNLGKISLRPKQRSLEDFNYSVHAAGFGIRYRTPVGPLRVDFAYSVNPPRFMGLKGTAEQLLDPKLTGVERVDQRLGRFQFHFSLGQSF